MPLLCPDDQRPLQPHPAGGACRVCGGVLCNADALTVLVPDANPEGLAPETRSDAPVLTKPRACPEDATPMTPLRIGKMEAWIERCPQCSRCWVERIDQRTLALHARQSRVQGAYASFTETERKELASDLARESVGDAYPISAFHQFLATLGLPVVRRTRGDTIPLATWGIALVLVAVFAFEQFNGGADDFARLHGLDPAHPELLAALGANLLHFGWLHLLGNLYFLLSFGDGVEQRLPRWMVVALFTVLGTLALGANAAVATDGGVIAGASGGIAVLMGACILLQPQARVVMRIGAPIIELPIWAYGIIELAYQALMSFAGVPGTAWGAHLAGLGMGLAVGAVARRFVATGATAAA